MKEKEFVTAIVLAAGRGTRMGTKIQKQYLDLCGKPVLYYSLHAFQESPVIDEILLVTGEQEIEYCRTEIVEKYQFTKVRKILPGGRNAISLSGMESRKQKIKDISLSTMEQDHL